jgi:hypothetical protein
VLIDAAKHIKVQTLLDAAKHIKEYPSNNTNTTNTQIIVRDTCTAVVLNVRVHGSYIFFA